MPRLVATIPTAVLERMTVEERSAVVGERVTPTGIVPVELRTFDKIEFRNDTVTGAWDLRGFASSYDFPYPIAGGPEHGGFTEIIARGAADEDVANAADVRLLFDHAGIPLARTASGTMTIRSLDAGIRIDAPNLDQSSPYVQSIRSAVLRGDADQMSFAFRVLEQSWNDDYTVRTITKLQVFDASIVTYPANPGTVAQFNKATPVGTITRGAVVNLLRAAEKRMESEVDEENLVEQIEALVARLIMGEAQEILDGGEAVDALYVLGEILRDLAWYESVDAYEDSLTTEVASVGRSLSLARAQAETARVCAVVA